MFYIFYHYMSFLSQAVSTVQRHPGMAFKVFSQNPLTSCTQHSRDSLWIDKVLRRVTAVWYPRNLCPCCKGESDCFLISPDSVLAPFQALLTGSLSRLHWGACKLWPFAVFFFHSIDTQQQSKRMSLFHNRFKKQSRAIRGWLNRP